MISDIIDRYLNEDKLEFNKCPKCGSKLFKSEDLRGNQYLECRKMDCYYERPYKKGKL